MGGLDVGPSCQRARGTHWSRVVSRDVGLGLPPGLGGTARCTAVVHPMLAMTLVLTGKTVDAREAQSLGLVDAVAQELLDVEVALGMAAAGGVGVS